MSTSIPYSQCAQAIARFYLNLDQGDTDELLACVAPDTVWLRQGKTLTGPDQIRAALAERNPDRITSHQCSNLHVTMEDATTASAVYYLTVYDNQHPSGGLQLKTILRSEDTFSLRDDSWVLTHKRSKKHL
ncbi:nuclear transport factor 2 family protein [Pusillimonas sp. MFBS29]|uniref:nuclear transport factor 2 family protein n=1 Tax=Pusillimonas sp. MFBS29 TaxID=2886690 RepID=UPI001D10EBFB|nr:nuclear transport factor 2 family protein [Pusillimonas sp. MFBS29]MCC2597216.1 nuclear transport factor 2 family protein [Pusillimonas sp. MFBS29]